MLQALREKTSGWIAFLILAAVSIPFAFFGIESYFQVRTDTFVAKVGEREISTDEYRARFQEYREQLRRAFGDAYDAAQFESPTAKREFLDRLVEEEVLAQAAERAGTSASDAALREAIAAIPAFQTEGRFDPNQYRLLLGTQGLTVAEFERRVRRDLSTRELPSQVAATAEPTPQAVDRYIALRDQTRDFRYVVFPLAPPPAEAPAEEAVVAWYEANKDQFQTEEQVSLQYVELEAAAFAPAEPPDEASLKARYQEQRARFVVGEQRLASHVLVRVAPNADAAAERAALEAAGRIAAEARAGADFARLARERSDDLGSKSVGGDLGWIEKGVTDPAFEAALFALAPGAISDPVKGADGYHVILLREIEPESIRSFDEVRQELADEFLAAERERSFAERSGELIDQVYADPSSLEPAARALGLELKRTGLFTRAGGPGIASNREVLRAAFSEQLLLDGAVSDAIELGPGHLVVLKIDEHKPRTPRPLSEVRESVLARMQDEAVQKASEARAGQIAARLAEGATLEALAAEFGGGGVESAAGVGRSALNHDSGVVTEAFRLARPPSPEAPTRAVVALVDGRRAAIELSAVRDADPAEFGAEARESARQQLLAGAQNDAGRAFIEALRSGFEIRIHEERM